VPSGERRRGRFRTLADYRDGPGVGQGFAFQPFYEPTFTAAG
jgi:hypothetical protein